MFTEYEIETLVAIEEVQEANLELKKDFIKNEAPYLEISDADFFSLVMLTPNVGVALANGSVSLFEEMALNKKARKLSKGGYFLKKDPVVFALKYLIKNYEEWEEKFLKVIRIAMETSFDIKSLEKDFDHSEKVSFEVYKKEILKTPYIFIRFLSAFFMEDEDDIVNSFSLSETDHRELVDIGQKLGLENIPVYQYFQQHIKIK